MKKLLKRSLWKRPVPSTEAFRAFQQIARGKRKNKKEKSRKRKEGRILRNKIPGNYQGTKILVKTSKGP